MIFSSSLGRSFTVILPEYCKRLHKNTIIRAKVQLEHVTSCVLILTGVLCRKTLGAWHFPIVYWKVKRRPLGTIVSFPGLGSTPYKSLYGEAPPERVFVGESICKRVRISQIEVHKRVGKSAI